MALLSVPRVVLPIIFTNSCSFFCSARSSSSGRVLSSEEAADEGCFLGSYCSRSFTSNTASSSASFAPKHGLLPIMPTRSSSSSFIESVCCDSKADNLLLYYHRTMKAWLYNEVINFQLDFTSLLCSRLFSSSIGFCFVFLLTFYFSDF